MVLVLFLRCDDRFEPSKCGADERRRRGLDRGEPLFLPRPTQGAKMQTNLASSSFRIIRAPQTEKQHTAAEGSHLIKNANKFARQLFPYAHKRTSNARPYGYG